MPGLLHFFVLKIAVNYLSQSTCLGRCLSPLLTQTFPGKVTPEIVTQWLAGVACEYSYLNHSFARQRESKAARSHGI